jgi:hypothetical protein
MRYMLTGDHWSAEEAQRIGVLQEIAPTREKALKLAVGIATKIAACGPLGIKATLASAHLRDQFIARRSSIEAQCSIQRTLRNRGLQGRPKGRGGRPPTRVSGQVINSASQPTVRQRGDGLRPHKRVAYRRCSCAPLRRVVRQRHPQRYTARAAERHPAGDLPAVRAERTAKRDLARAQQRRRRQGQFAARSSSWRATTSIRTMPIPCSGRSPIGNRTIGAALRARN